MYDIYDERNWIVFLEEHPELKKLVTKARLENNPERVRELDGALPWSFCLGTDKSEAEKELVMHLFIHDYNKSNTFCDDSERRLLMANEEIKKEL